jgi:hypothetical protein
MYLLAKNEKTIADQQLYICLEFLQIFCLILSIETMLNVRFILKKKLSIISRQTLKLQIIITDQR